MQTIRRHLLLTGIPGVGKTTVIRRVAEGLGDLKPGGFYTEEIRKFGVRQGFELHSFNHQKWFIAHIDYSKHYRVGKYGVDVSAIDAAAETLLIPGKKLYLVDEIGKMESLSARFVEAMQRLLEANNTVVATIGKKGDGFIEEVKQRTDVELWEITVGNRDMMPQQVLAWIKDC